MKTMKRLFLLSLTLSAFLAFLPEKVQAQIPPASDPHCAYCGVNLRTGEAHKKGCEYYSEPEDEESSSSPSTHLKDYEPLPEVKSNLNMDYENYQLMYKAGSADAMVQCPVCRKIGHNGSCRLESLQKQAKQYKEKALTATTKEAREAALRDFHRTEEELKNVFENAMRKLRENENRGSARERQNQAGTGQHLVSTNIRNEYDKKLTSKYGATAYGKTYHNGQEMWVLYDYHDNKIGEYAKVEMIDDHYFKVRDSRGNYGLCDSGKELFPPQYSSMEAVYYIYKNGKSLYLDVTKRGSDGLLKHGLLDVNTQAVYGGGQGYVLPCEYDRIELINFENRAKITKNGRMGAADIRHGKIIVQPEYEYLNTYFVPDTYINAENKRVTVNRLFYIVGNGGKFGAWDDSEWHKKMVIPMEYTVDQVKSMLEKQYK